MLLWVGAMISSIGSGLTSFGLGVYIFQKTGSAADMALVTLLGFLPTLLLSVPAGVLADKYDRRILMMIGDGLSAMGILFILVCMMTGEAQLWQICMGVFVSGSFSALLEPAFRATITDLLTKEEFSKASGLVSMAGSARYLFSPIIAGLLLSVSDVKLLLVIDICTFVLTVAGVAVIRKSIAKKTKEDDKPFLASMKEGWTFLRQKRGVFVLVILSSVITLFIGMFQILAEAIVLSFTDAKTLGIAETICASGMLVSGILLGIRGIKKGFVKVLSLSLMLSGLFIIGYGLFENINLISAFGFLFFAAIAFSNNSLDYLVRTNIPDEVQGRVWGLIGFISQIGYVISYATSGVFADFLGDLTGRGVGRGSAMVVIISGICLIVISASVYLVKNIRRLETESEAAPKHASESSSESKDNQTHFQTNEANV